jgi:hypothetical protein
VVVNRRDDLQMRLAEIDVFTEYRLLVEDRYPDVFILTTEVLEDEPLAPRTKARSKDSTRRRAR